MLVIACAAPSGTIEPAPLTSLPRSAFENPDATFAAFWASDDRYYVRAAADGANHWFRIESEDAMSEVQSLESAVAARVADGGERRGGVAFPLGSTGRTVFRVWSAKGTARPERTKILGVRAGRSRRLPA